MRSPLLALPNTYRAFYGSFLGLRPAQRASIAPVLDGRDLLLQAATGSGKTEAVLAPCLERLIQQRQQRVVLYIVPTRALAWDLIRRLEGPLRRLSMTMAVRTGDLKRRGSGKPDILLTTPESLDVAMGSSNTELRALLSRTGAVIIDEVHVFAGRPRGFQLQLLLTRLGRRLSQPLQRLALSATVADPGAIITGMQMRADAIRLSVPGGGPPPVRLVHLQDDGDLVALIEDLQRAGARRMLLFSDSRRRCERRYALLSAHLAGSCFLHYSNLSTQKRREVEADFRTQRRALCVATSTLELGIDIGDIDTILLDGPPASGAAFLQRIGRAGRRGGAATIWGLCHGARASDQLARFLGLLHMARRGMTEPPGTARFPSVLAQQVASCLYETRRLSLPALQALFPEHADAIAQIIPTMQRHRWLKRDRVGLLIGGHRYYQARVEQRLWSNFPPEQLPFSLEVEGAVLAELPAALVRQLDVGDRVQLVGQRLVIRDILAGERRRVLAAATQAPETTSLSWAGLSAPVSIEAARAARDAIRAQTDWSSSLTRRTTALLEGLRARPCATLDSGLTVYREVDGGVRYLTWLGTLGNLILREAIGDMAEEDLSPWSDALGVSVSRLIDLRRLTLPTDRAGFVRWIQRHMKVLRAAVPLGAFAGLLPEELLVEELLAHLHDRQLCEAYRRYTSLPGDVVEGSLDPAPHTAPPPKALPAAGASLLAAARQSHPPPPPPPSSATRPLTATRIASWIRHDQCARFLQWSARSRSAPPPTPRAQHGLAHEAAVLEALSETSVVRDTGAASRPFPERIQRTRDRLIALIEAGGGYLSGAALQRDGVLGVPDLLEVTVTEAGVWIAPGDIKSSAAARYDQKWQVALYAWLLRPLAEAVGATPLEEGFLLVRPVRAPLGAFSVERFSLTPWLAVLPRALAEATATQEGAAGRWRLTGWCTGCAFSPHCYHEALTEVEVQLLPGLSAGALVRLRMAGIRRLSAVAALPDGGDWGTLPGQARAIVSHTITPAPLPERQLPDRTAPLVFVALEEDPETGALVAIGLAGEDAQVHRLTDLRRLQEAIPPGAWLLHDGGRVMRILELLGLVVPTDPHTGLPHRLDLRTLRRTDFRLPLLGAASLWQAGQLLALTPALSPPESLLHLRGEDPLADRLQVMIALWQWMRPMLTPARSSAGPQPVGAAMLQAQLRFLNRQHVLSETRVRRLQALPLAERVARFRAIGPLTVTESTLDAEGRLVYILSAAEDISATGMREGDFLRLAALGMADPQDGIPVILDLLEPATGRLAVRMRGRRRPQIGQRCSLEEDLADWLYPRLLAVSQAVLRDPAHPLAVALRRRAPALPPSEAQWAAQWLSTGPSLQARQAEALMLAFQHRIAVIQGPPGTGKTFLLAWILVAALQRAAEQGRPLRVAVTALTHQAIDQLLGKVCAHLEHAGMTVPVRKLGRACDGIRPLRSGQELQEHARLIVGGTGYGLNRLCSAQPIFDLIAVDEASQLLPPQAWLALVCGRAAGGQPPRMLLVGDQHQLGPVIQGEPDETSRSILARMLEHQASTRLNCSYRLSDGLCDFPSQVWYGGDLYPASPRRRLSLTGAPRGDWCDAALDPSHPTTLLVLEHQGCAQHSAQEAAALAQLLARLVERGVGPERIAILSPHRTHNSLIRATIAGQGDTPLPIIDTVERLQGAERDVVMLSMIASDPDHIDSLFLNDPRRFNVAITRARLKLVVVASRALIEAIPRSEEALLAGQHLRSFVAHCRARGAIVAGAVVVGHEE